MVNKEIKVIKDIIQEKVNLQTVLFTSGDKGYNYPFLSGKVKQGDEVLVNTTAVDLKLGTGGYHFVIAKYPFEKEKKKSKGHIMKLRYTPLQFKTYPIEEQLGKQLDYISLKGTIVITAELHSMLAPIVLSLKKLNAKVKVAYVMTDSGSLSATHSNSVTLLKKHKLIEGVITSGHSFGGDLEAINPISGIQGAKIAYDADVIVVSMGPGIVGTGTQFGFTGIEQSYLSDLAQNIGCTVYPAIRLSFIDSRKRHRGLSHHYLTNFGYLCNGRFDIVLPKMARKKTKFVLSQIKKHNISKKHHLNIANGVNISDISKEFQIPLSSMGKGYDENRDFFNGLTSLGRYVSSFY
ncbi:DUF3866 family protein [Proteinivorax tanatarense]|uniref:DUF3866 family protein n=1 Tax=Proteinivorax tanatarense TaxID=1260629 RepID=A0AAU7VPG2_9FIRM